MAVFERPNREDQRAAKHQQRLERVGSALSQLAEPGKSLAHWKRCALALAHAKPWKFIRDEARFVEFERLVAEAAEAATEPEIRSIMAHLRSVRAHIINDLSDEDADFEETIQYIDSANFQLDRLLRARQQDGSVARPVQTSIGPVMVTPLVPRLQPDPRGAVAGPVAVRVHAADAALAPLLQATMAFLPFIGKASESSVSFKYRNWLEEMSELGAAHGQPGAGHLLACDALAICAASERHRADVERLLDRLSIDDLGAIMISAPGGLANQPARDLLFKLADDRMSARRQAAIKGFVDAAATVGKRLAYSQTRHSARLADALIELVPYEAALADWSLRDSPSGQDAVEARIQLHRKLMGLGENAFSDLDPGKRADLVDACLRMRLTNIPALGL